jgi:hypothetical protein
MLFEVTPNVTDAPTTWDFGVAGVLEPGRYTVSVSASVAADIDDSVSNLGGSGEYAMSFLASPRPLGDANGDGAVDRTDLNRWGASFGFTSVADANGDGVIDGGDLLRLQTPPWNSWIPPNVTGWELATWRRAFGLAGGGDTDGDGDADGSDFLMWQRKLASVSPAVSVPETHTWQLAEVAVIVVVTLRRRRILE